MTDLTWLSAEADKIHMIFYGLFFLLATVVLLIGVLVEYFRLPLGGSANFSSLIGRALIATLLLSAYPEITNWIADASDALASKIGGLNTLDSILENTSVVLEKVTWSWTSIGDSLLWIITYLVYAVLYLTVFVFDAIVLYGWTLLYIFSPLLILMFILPQTAGATKLLFRAHFELAAYKIVWSVLGTLLWSSALANLGEQLGDKPNFFVALGFMVLVAFSIIFTPKIVSGLINSGVSGMASHMGAMGFGAMSAGIIGPAGLTKVMKMPGVTGAKLTQKGFSKFQERSERRKNQPWKQTRKSRSKVTKVIPPK